MRKNIKIAILAVLLVMLFSTFVSAEVVVNGKNIDLDLTPEEITADTYLPLAELVDKDLVDIDQVNADKFLVFYKNDYYLLESNLKEVKSNRGDRKLNYSPLKINDHFLVPVEFLDRFLNLNIDLSGGGLTMPDEYDRSQSRSNLRLRVYLNDDEFDRDEELELVIEVLNIDNNTQTLRFNSAHKYNIYVKNRFGRVLYSWADGKIFSQARQDIDIKGRDSLRFKEEINLRQFSEGTYTLEIEMLADNYDFDKIEKRFKIDD